MKYPYLRLLLQVLVFELGCCIVFDYVNRIKDGDQLVERLLLLLNSHTHILLLGHKWL